MISLFVLCVNEKITFTYMNIMWNWIAFRVMFSLIVASFATWTIGHAFLHSKLFKPDELTQPSSFQCWSRWTMLSFQVIQDIFEAITFNQVRLSKFVIVYMVHYMIETMGACNKFWVYLLLFSYFSVGNLTCEVLVIEFENLVINKDGTFLQFSRLQINSCEFLHFY